MNSNENSVYAGGDSNLQGLMEEGYREMAEDNRRLAEESFPETNEMLLKYTQWD